VRDGFYIIVPVKKDVDFSNLYCEYACGRPQGRWPQLDALFHGLQKSGSILDFAMTQITPDIARAFQQANEDLSEGKSLKWWLTEPETVLAVKTVEGKSAVYSLVMCTRVAIVITEHGKGIPPEQGPPQPPGFSPPQSA